MLLFFQVDFNLRKFVFCSYIIFILAFIIFPISYYKYELTSSLDYFMSSKSSQRSSSSQGREKHPSRVPVQRSRSREKDYRRSRTQNNPPQNRKAKIRIPQLTSSLISYRSFQQYQNERINEEQTKRAFDKYKRDWEEKQNQLFVNSYRDDAWFRQKYDPQFLDAIQTQRKENVKKNSAQFISQMQKNTYRNIDLGVKDIATLGFTLSSDRYEQDQDPFNVLINPQMIDVGLNQSIDITQQPFFGFDPDYRTLFAKNVPKSISRFDIYEVVRKLDGFKNLTVSQPVKKHNFSRYCWVEFFDDESFVKADLATSGLMIKDQNISFSKSLSKMKKIKVLKNYPTSRIQADLQTIVAMTGKLDKQCQVENNQLFEWSFDSQKRKMDTFLLYLRRVHAFDYFTSKSFESERLLTLKTGSIFVRLQVDYQELEDVQTVFKKIKQVNDAKIAKESVRPDYLGILRIQIEKYIRQTQKLTKDQVKQVWKCSICDKKFKTCEFLAKHIIVKHAQIKDKKVKYLMDQAYMKDPNKITSLSMRDDRDSFRGRRPYSNFRRGGRRENYKDLDQPEGEKQTKTINKPLINYLDI